MYRVDSYDDLCASTPSTKLYERSLSEYSDCSSLNSSILDNDPLGPRSLLLHNTMVTDDDDDNDDDDDMSTNGDTTEFMSFSNTVDLCDDLKFIIGMPEMCDVKFLVGKEKVPIHAVKAILATRSRAFYKLILSHQRTANTREPETSRKENKFLSKLRKLRRRSAPANITHRTLQSASGHLIIDIEDFEPETFRRVILYLHSGNISVSLETVVGVMNAADTYGLHDLRSACFRFAGRFINLTTVLPLLLSTEPYIGFKWTSYIKEEILEYITEKAQDVFRLREFEHLPKQTALLIFLRPELKATEEAKWDAALRWSRRYCSKREINLFRSTIKIFTPKINFYDIPLNKLTQEILPLSILSESLINRVIAHQTCPRLVIGQERTPSIAPQKPPRRRNHGNARRALALHPLATIVSQKTLVHRHPSSVSSSSGSSDSGLASSSEDCSTL